MDVEKVWEPLLKLGVIVGGTVVVYGVPLVFILAGLGDRIVRKGPREALNAALYGGAGWAKSIAEFFASFTAIFDRIFKSRPLKLGGMSVMVPSFGRSVLSSMIAFAAVFVVWWARFDFRGTHQLLVTTAGWTPIFVLGALVSNGLTDYLSLCSTRILMSKVANVRGSLARVGWLLVDLVLGVLLTFTAYAMLLMVAAHLPVPVRMVGGLRPWNVDAKVIWELFWAGVTFSKAYGNELWSFGAVYVWSNLMTSAWLWLFALGGIVTKAAMALDWLRKSLDRTLELRAHPVKVIACIVVVLLVLGALGLRRIRPESWDVYIIARTSARKQAVELASLLRRQGVTSIVHEGEGEKAVLQRLNASDWVILLDRPGDEEFVEFSEGGTWRISNRAKMDEPQLRVVEREINCHRRGRHSVRVWPARIDPRETQALTLAQAFAQLATTTVPAAWLPPGAQAPCNEALDELSLSVMALPSIADDGVPALCGDRCTRAGFCGESCDATDAGCIASQSCLKTGRCAALAGRCFATEDGCRRSEGCLNDGLCLFKNGICVADLGSCQASGHCRTNGDCGLGDKSCRATAAGCTASSRCTESGECGFDGRACVATGEGCAHSASCIASGTCGFDGNACLVTPDACANSAACKERGLCGLKKGACAPTREGCLLATRCKEQGECVSGNTSCERVSKACSAAEGCVEAESCERDGLCDIRAGRLVATKEGCQRSVGCSRDGRCELAGDVCVATGETCGASPMCRLHGACGVVDARCALSESGCGRSEDCMVDGLCLFDGKQCVAKPASCLVSKACEVSGLCGFADAKCVATAEGCRKSLRCRDWGICTAREGACRK